MSEPLTTIATVAASGSPPEPGSDDARRLCADAAAALLAATSAPNAASPSAAADPRLVPLQASRVLLRDASTAAPLHAEGVLVAFAEAACAQPSDASGDVRLEGIKCLNNALLTSEVAVRAFAEAEGGELPVRVLGLLREEGLDTALLVRCCRVLVYLCSSHGSSGKRLATEAGGIDLLVTALEQHEIGSPNYWDVDDRHERIEYLLRLMFVFCFHVEGDVRGMLRGGDSTTDGDDDAEAKDGKEGAGSADTKVDSVGAAGGCGGQSEVASSGVLDAAAPEMSVLERSMERLGMALRDMLLNVPTSPVTEYDSSALSTDPAMVEGAGAVAVAVAGGGETKSGGGAEAVGAATEGSASTAAAVPATAADSAVAVAVTAAAEVATAAHLRGIEIKDPKARVVVQEVAKILTLAPDAFFSFLGAAGVAPTIMALLYSRTEVSVGLVAAGAPMRVQIQANDDLFPLLVASHKLIEFSPSAHEQFKALIFPTPMDDIPDNSYVTAAGKVEKHTQPTDSPFGSFRYMLLKLMTFTETGVKRAASEFLWMLCDSSAEEFTARTGFGNAVRFSSYGW